MDSQTVMRLQQIAEKFGCQIELEEAEDRSYIDCVIQKPDIDMYIGLLPGRRGKYHANDLTSTALPRDLYADAVAEETSARARNEEILATVEKILSRQVEFHGDPGLFNKNRGYIILPIDGAPTKLYQKDNYFHLPVR